MKSQDIAESWKKIVVGQDHAIDKITPYIVRGMAKLNAPKRPLAIFFLMGGTGTGKTLTSESLSKILHGTENNVLRIDCGEYQNDHEVAKLLGAPPGYLGHRETQPAITQAKLTSVTTENCGISIVLFDEIEKAANTLWRVLLGILDKGVLKLGDSTTVNFENSIIFMTSNLAAKEIETMLTGTSFGFNNHEHVDASEANFKRLEKMGINALRNKFPPEFPNRIDEVITYYPLNAESLRKIAILEIEKIKDHVFSIGSKSFLIQYDDSVIDFVADIGTDIKFGAREIKRTLVRYLLNPLADDILGNVILPLAVVRLTSDGNKIMWDVNNPTEEEIMALTNAVEEPKKTRKVKGSII